MAPSPYAKMRAHGFPWSPAADLIDPELKYWLSRTEETCRLSPSLSTDLIRATKVEVKALLRSKHKFNRWTAHMLCFIASVALGVGLGHYLGSQLLLGSAPWRYIAPVFFVVSVWRTFVRPRVYDRFAHRAVVARDRLNRWLAPAQPNCLDAAPQRMDQRYSDLFGV